MDINRIFIAYLRRSATRIVGIANMGTPQAV